MRALIILTWLIVAACGSIVHGYDRDFYNYSPRLLQEETTDDSIFTNNITAGNNSLSSIANDIGDAMDETFTDSNTTAPTPPPSFKPPAPAPNQTRIIRDSCKLYLSVFTGLFILFLLVRSLFPRVYNFKKNSTKFYVSVANDSFGHISWLWKIFTISDDDIREQCGMDALTTLRVMQSGVKLSLVGVFNSVFLFPVYSYMGNGSRPNDPMYSLSLSDMGRNNSGAFATIVAAYFLFGAALYFIIKDFEWFTSHRHSFLSKICAQNLSVYLSGLPPEMQSNKAVRSFFQRCFSHDAVAEAHVALTTSVLDQKVAERDAFVPLLEHGINEYKLKNRNPTHKTKFCVVPSVPFWSQEIKDLNDEIQDRQKVLDTKIKEMDDNFVEGNIAVKGPTINILGTMRSAKNVVLGVEDGTPKSAAFVTFSDLTSANIIRQTVQYASPWSVVPEEPPMPELVNWTNVGVSSHARHVGELISFGLSVSLCIFWTIPVAFVQTISNVEGLKGLLPFLKEPVENNEWVADLLAVLAPLILLIFLSLLPKILLAIVKFERGIEIETFKHPSLFSKLAIFTIVQTFFISTISSTLMDSIQGIIDDPMSGIKLLSEALPAQAGFFIQLMMVQVLVPLSIELLRIIPIVMNFIRKLLANLLGHNITEKEKHEMFILPSLNDPAEFYFGTEFGMKFVMIMMVQYVYSCMSPITSYFTLIVFSFLTVGLRNQFLFIYPPMNDSGGKLWLNLQRLSVVYMIIAEIVLFVLMLSKNYIAAMLLIPLIVVTILFKFHTARRHYLITNHLPIEMCAAIDGQYQREGIIDETFKNAYLQPSLKTGSNFPDNYDLIEEEFGRTDRSVSDGCDEVETAIVVTSSGSKQRSMRDMNKDTSSAEIGTDKGTKSLSDTSDHEDKQASLLSLLFVQHG